MTHTEAALLLRVELPVTPNALKTAFRRRASEEHPDKSKHPQAAERFQEVQAAFELLERSEHVVGTPVEAKCADGTPLTECGLGLGPTVNGRPCNACHGKGYLAILQVRSRCPDCRPIFEGLWSLAYEPPGYNWKCPRCQGSGRFVRNGRDIGECYRCRGKGRIRTRENHCETCGGSGRNPTVGTTYYVRCLTCNGTGEVKVWNPVLPKGLFTGKGGS